MKVFLKWDWREAPGQQACSQPGKQPVQIREWADSSRVFSIIGCCKILTIVPCAIQLELVVYSVCNSLYLLISKLPIHPFPLPLPVWQHKSVLHVCESVSFTDRFICVVFYKQYHIYLSLSIYFTYITSQSMFLQMALFLLFLWLSSIPLYISIHTTFSLSIHLSVDI